MRKKKSEKKPEKMLVSKQDQEESPEKVTVAASLSMRDLRKKYSYVWQGMLNRMLEEAPKGENLTPEDFMVSCIFAADSYVRALDSLYDESR